MCSLLALSASAGSAIGLVMLGFFAVFVSCLVARIASGDRASWLWGVLGPVGWVLAALRGVQERIDDLRANKGA